MSIRKASSLVILSLLCSILAGVPLKAGTTAEVMGGVVWGPEIKISSDAGAENQTFPAIAVDGDEVHVVWAEESPGGYDHDIYYRHYDGAIWKPEVKISTATSSRMQGRPSIDVDGDKLHVVWEYSDHIVMVDPDYELRYRLLNGTNWEPEQVISTRRNTVFWPAPAIAADGDTVHVIWMVNTSGALKYGGPIYYRVFNGTGWGPETEFITGFNRYQSIVAQNGTIHVSWESYGEFDSSVFYRYFNGTSWQPDQDFGVPSVGVGNHNPSLAVEGNEVHFAWRYGFNGPFDIYHRLFDGVSWTSPAKVNEDPPWDPWFDGDPSIAVNGGDVHVAWVSQEDGDFDINYRLLGGSVQRINADSGSAWQTSPSVAAEGGRIHAVWTDERDGNADIYFRSGIVDSSDPESSADPIAPYWQTNLTLSIEWTATDDHCLANVSLYYRYSFDNSSWSSWNEWARNNSVSGTSATGSFPFQTDLDGYYEFYTVASDTSGNEEPPPVVPDAITAVAMTPLPPTNFSASLSGGSYENVWLTWDTSLDDGGGRKNVVLYQVFKGTIFDPSGLNYSPLGLHAAPYHFHVDSLAGEGNPNDYFYYVCVYTAFGKSSCTVDQAAKITRPLSKGTNLVSIPLIQSSESIEIVLQTVFFDAAWTYDSSTIDWKSYVAHKPYKGDLRNMDHKNGLWVNATALSNLTVAGIVPLTTTIQLRAGWNLAGFPSFNPTYTVGDLKTETGASRVEGFDASASPYFLKALQDSDVLSAGRGYWIYVPGDAAWTVSNT